MIMLCTLCAQNKLKFILDMKCIFKSLYIKLPFFILHNTGLKKQSKINGYTFIRLFLYATVRDIRFTRLLFGIGF